MDILDENIDLEKLKVAQAGEELGMIKGKRIILNNLLKFIEEDIEHITKELDVNTMSEINKNIFTGMKIAYSKLTKMANEGLEDVEVDDLERKNMIKRGTS